MEEKDEIIYPVTPKTLHDYANKLFSPILRDECITGVWVPMAGRSMWNKFIVENIHLFSEELPNYNKYLLVYVEPLDLTEESLNGYLQLIGRSALEVIRKVPSLFEKFTSEEKEAFTRYGVLYPELLSSLKSLLYKIAENGYHTVLFLGEFDELNFTNKIFFNNLKSLWVNLYPNLQYVFPMVKSLTDPENILGWDELREPILQNVIYVPIRQGDDMEYTVDFFAKRDNLTIDQNMKEVMYEVCGGHPYMLKIAVRTFRNQGPFNSTDEFKFALLHSYELHSAAKGIFNPRTESEQESLKKIAAGKKLSPEDILSLKDLKKLGIITENEQKEYHIFSEVFSNFLLEFDIEEQDKDTGKRIDLDQSTGAIRFNNKPVDEHFTRQEYSILVLFLQKPDSVLTRDDIGAVLWGEDNYQKYSDWAIDQLMSKLRKRLKDIRSTARILTLRKRGYKFVQD